VPFTARTLELLAQMRVEVTAITDAQTRALTAAWVTAWDEVAGGLQEAAQDVADRGLTAARAIRTKQMAASLQHIADQLDALAEQSRLLITGDLGQVVSATINTHTAIISSQLPTSAGTAAEVVVQAPSADLLEQVVSRSAQQITAAHWPLSAEAEDAVRRELIRGVAGGANPKITAARMVRRAEGGFNGGLTRALTISRTETLDAHRNAARAHDLANADTLTGWQWIAQLTARTCPSCWEQHGTVHPVDEAGPLDHQNGRCARAPKTKTWADLGFPDLDEPADLLPDARATFGQLPRNEQMRVMGPARLKALDAGLPWEQLSTVRSTPGWRDSIVPTPVRDLVAAGH
jgi:hypothetical protein